MTNALCLFSEFCTGMMKKDHWLYLWRNVFVVSS